MTGILNVGECTKGFAEDCVTSKFYRLEKKERYVFGEYYDVYEFYTVDNGNIYYCSHLETIDRQLDCINEPVRFGNNKNEKDKAKGNEMYKKLIKEGYEFVGEYLCDIYGYAKRIR